jgi:hypothetical protein
MRWEKVPPVSSSSGFLVRRLSSSLVRRSVGTEGMTHYTGYISHLLVGQPSAKDSFLNKKIWLDSGE